MAGNARSTPEDGEDIEENGDDDKDVAKDDA